MESVIITEIDVLKHKLLSMGSTEERAFEEAIAKFVTQKADQDIDLLHSIINSDDDINVKFRAFFALITYHRRQSNISEFRKLVDLYIEQFQDFKLHHHILALLYKLYDTHEGILESIECGRKAVDVLPSHIGVLHNFAEAVVQALEENIEVDVEDLEKASSSIDFVIKLSDYAKFHCTYGRLLAQKGDFNRAKKEINRAIDLEDSHSMDYSIRISEYRNILSQIKTLELYKSVENEIVDAKTTVVNAQGTVTNILESTQEKMETMKQQNIQMLAFFTAIISFIIGSINIASNQNNFMQAALLIIVLAGALIVANVAFSILLTNVKQAVWKYVFVAGLGILLVIGGFAGYFLI